MRQVQLYYFDDCPSYQQALEHLRRALKLEQLPDEVEDDSCRRCR